VNAEFMKDTTELSRIPKAEEEVQHMGEFLLLAAQERAREAGIEAETICRRGNVRESIEKVVKEVDAEILVLGLPLKDTRERRFSLSRLQEFAQHIEEETGVRVVIAD